jgi:hypothetical protein
LLKQGIFFFFKPFPEAKFCNIKTKRLIICRLAHSYARNMHVEPFGGVEELFLHYFGSRTATNGPYNRRDQIKNSLVQVNLIR